MTACKKNCYNISLHKAALIPPVHITQDAKIQTNQSMFRGSFFLHLSSVA